MIKAADVKQLSDEAAYYLNSKLKNIVSDEWSFCAKNNTNLGACITLLVYKKNHATNVTFHNSHAYIHLMCHLTDNCGNIVDIDKVSFEILTGNIKFRKISDKSIIGAARKVITWFEKNYENADSIDYIK